MACSTDQYATECQIIRALAGAIYEVTGKRPVDPNWETRRRDVQQYELRVQRMDVRFHENLLRKYDRAMGRGQWKGTAAVHGPGQYWQAGVLAYFDGVRVGTPPNDADYPITTREKLRQYDRGLYSLVAATMAYRGKVDWRRLD